jgi:hypothetical protein
MVTILDTVALITHTTARRHTGIALQYMEGMVVQVAIMVAEHRLCVTLDHVLAHTDASRFVPKELNRLRRNHRQERHIPRMGHPGEAVLLVRMALLERAEPTGRAAHAEGSNRARSAGSWG